MTARQKVMPTRQRKSIDSSNILVVKHNNVL